MSCSSSTNAPLVSLWALRLGSSVDDTREAFHTALANAAESDTPDQLEVAAYMRRHLAAVTATVDPGTSPRRVMSALQRMAAQIHEVESGATVIDGRTFAAWQAVGDSYLPRQGVSVPVPVSGATGESGAVAAAPRRRRQYAGGGRRPYHKRFTRFSTQTLEATDELFNARPSRLSDSEKLVVFQRWMEKTSEAYGMEVPVLKYVPEQSLGGGGMYVAEEHAVYLERMSVTTLLHEFRHAMQARQAGPPMLGTPQSDMFEERERWEVDARAWSLSLYYQCRPQLMERLVREGKILHLPASDLD